MKKQPKLFPPDNDWSALNEFIEAGGVIPEVAMRFHAACGAIRRQHNSGDGAFRRTLFRILQERCGLASFAEVAERFMFDEAEIPVDEVADAPEIAAELKQANDELSAAETKREAAMQKARAAAERLQRIDTLKAELPRLKDSLEYLHGLPAIWREDIANAEDAIERVVYSTPKYQGIGHPDAFVLEKQKVIEAARAAIAAHPERIKKAQARIERVKQEITDLKGKASKKVTA